jgi:gamma-glutamyltranspeptidase / glutathione hydrolase
VLQTLLNRVDFGLTLPDAVAAPRASQRNGEMTQAEPAFIAAYGPALEARGHMFMSVAEIGAVTAIERQSDGNLLAVAEPVRRGGGDAGVVRPSRDHDPEG